MRTLNKSRASGKDQIELQTLRKEHQDQNNTMKALGSKQKHHESTKHIESTKRTPRLD
jgi:hypothetical protein